MESQICEFCLKEKQTPLHLLVWCQKAQDLWQLFQKFILQCTTAQGNELAFTPENIMLNLVYPKSAHMVNLLTLIVKQHIFYCKCAGKKLDFEEAICKIESIFEIERYNASVQGLRKKHEAKWSCYHSPEKPIKLSSKESTKYNTAPPCYEIM